jgi:predicted PurR-regulated permease PerM
MFRLFRRRKAKKDTQPAGQPDTTAQPVVAVVQAVPRSVQLTMAVALISGIVFVSPYFGAIAFSALIAFIFDPVYKYVLSHTKHTGLALAATFTAAIISVVIPIVLVASITIAQAGIIVADFKEKTDLGTAQIDEAVERSTSRINHIVTSLPGGKELRVDPAKVQNALTTFVSEFLQGLVELIKRTAGAVSGLISTSILSFFLIVGMLRYQKQLIGFIKNLSPFHADITETYLDQAAVMTKAMVKGQFIIAACQGLASALSLWLVGLNYFGFFLVVLSFLSFIPLGAGIVTIPIGIVFILTGNIWQGAFIILFHIFGVSNIDNLLRPHLVPRKARLNPALLLLSVFSGLALFGAAGVVIGPVLIIIIITTFQMYAEYNKRISKPLPPGPITFQPPSS